MIIPSSAYGIVVFIVLVLPGIVYGITRAAVSGTRAHDKDWSARILQALLVSIGLDAVYLLIFGRHIVSALTAGRETLTDHPRQVAIAALILGIVIPAIGAYLIHGQLRWQQVSTRGRFVLKLPRRQTGYRPAPTAWDEVARNLEGRWVRVRIGDGKWIGGWFGSKSYVSTYPEPRDIYIEDQHLIDAAGVIGSQLPDTAGVWLAIKDGDIVEWIDPSPTATPPPDEI
jgi:hypothetical protein